MSLHSIRERINLLIYDSKSRVLGVLQLVSFVISLLAIGALLVYYGFPRDVETEFWLNKVIEGSFAFYVLRYLIRIFYDFSPRKFLRKTWFEGAIMLLLVVEGISYNLFDQLLLEELFVQLGFAHFPAFSTLAIQLILLVVVGTELGSSSNILPSIRWHPARLFMASFGFLVAIGTGLLMLPEMTVGEGSMPFLDAMFTSTSASCVTGLIVVDTGTYFTLKGQVVLLLLIKLGGLNIVSFATLTAFLNKWGVGVKHHAIMEDFLTRESPFSARGLFVRIVGISILVEAVGTVMIYALIDNSMELQTVGDKVFFAVFHSVSAFNNAGFSTFTDGLSHAFLQEAYLLHIVIGGLVFAGALGFTTIFDLFSLRNLRDRLKNPWKTPHVSTRIALHTYLILAVAGAGIYFLIEQGHSLANQNLVEETITSSFLSVSARSAGFSTVDLHTVAMPTIILLLVLMFIGGNTYSTAGGIKTSTFTLILLSVWSTIRGRKNVELYRRSVPQDNLIKAFSVLMFSIGGMLTGIFLLSITEADILAMEGRGMMDLIFEEVSAFSTCGLSTGVTHHLSDAGKIIVMVSMYIGRIGTLTVAFALSKPVEADYHYPDEHIMVG